MITLGITGRSGCGKSTVTAVFAAHGVPLVDADQISREILLPGSPLLPVLARRFGADILYADGSLNRRLLADRAFAAPEGKAALDSLVLPEIIRRVCRLKQAAREAGAPLFVIDGAVIVGTDAEKECDHLCVVTAPFATSVARIAARDGIAPEMAARRLNAQTPEEVLLALPPVRRQVEQRLYPRKYNDLVEQYAAEYDLDPLLVYSFIRTESGFDPGATSSVDARGLMQMTEETFLWLRSKLGLGEEVSFGDLYDPDVSIRFGCYYLHLCLVRYNGDISTAAAAYHSGWGTVDALLQKEEHSEDGLTLSGFPYNQMHHYVEKITACYAKYTELYGA